MILAAIIAILIGGGTYLILQRGMLRIIVGIALISHGVNLLILSTGIGAWRTEPLMDRANPGEAADPLPQAFVLTAIVISMASTAVMLAMAALGRDDDTATSEDPESGFRRMRSFQTMGRGTHRAGLDDRDAALELKELRGLRAAEAAKTAGAAETDGTAEETGASPDESAATTEADTTPDSELLGLSPTKKAPAGKTPPECEAIHRKAAEQNNKKEEDN